MQLTKVLAAIAEITAALPEPSGGTGTPNFDRGVDTDSDATAPAPTSGLIRMPMTDVVGVPTC